MYEDDRDRCGACVKERVTARRRLEEVKDTARMRLSFRCYGVDHRFGHTLRLCEKPSRAKAQSVPSVAETMVNAQLINWFQAVEIKIRQIAFVLPTITPKKSQNMSRIFLVGIFFYDTRNMQKTRRGERRGNLRRQRTTGSFSLTSAISVAA
jgi:hypothetical protein